MNQPLDQQGGNAERRGGGFGRWFRRGVLAAAAGLEARYGGQPQNISHTDLQAFQKKNSSISQPVNPNLAVSGVAKGKEEVGTSPSQSSISSDNSPPPNYSIKGKTVGPSQNIFTSKSTIMDTRSILDHSNGPNTALIQATRELANPDFGVEKVRQSTGNETVDAILDGFAKIGSVLENFPLPVAAACNPSTASAFTPLSTPTREKAFTQPTPIPNVEIQVDRDHLSKENEALAASLVVSLNGPVSDVKPASPIEVTVLTMRKNAEKIITNKFGPGTAQNFRLVVPISDYIVNRSRDPQFEPPSYLLDTKTGIKYSTLILKTGSNLLTLPNNTEFAYLGDQPVVSSHGSGISELTGKPQGDRVYSPNLGGMLDLSNVDTGKLSSKNIDQLLAGSSNTLDFVRKELENHPDAEFNYLVSIDKNGNLGKLIIEEFAGIKKVGMQKNDGSFSFVPDKYLLTPGRKLQPDKYGNLHSVIAGHGNNEDQEFDEGIFNPDKGIFEYSEAFALFTPTPFPTATPKPIPTEKPTPVPSEFHASAWIDPGTQQAISKFTGSNYGIDVTYGDNFDVYINLTTDLLGSLGLDPNRVNLSDKSVLQTILRGARTNWSDRMNTPNSPLRNLLAKTLLNYPNQQAVKDGKVFAYVDGNKLSLVDISNPAAPKVTLIGPIDPGQPLETVKQVITEKNYPNTIFVSNGESLNDYAGPDEYLQKQGTRLSVIDATGSGKGKVIKAEVAGNPIDQGNYWAYRGYPSKNMHIAGEIKIEETIWVDPAITNEIDSYPPNQQKWFTHLNLFDSSQWDGGPWHVGIRSGIDNLTGGYMFLTFKDGLGNDIRITNIIEGAPKFTPGTWHRMAIEVRQEGQKYFAYLFQDGQPVMKGELPSSLRKDDAGRPIWVNYHGGLYAGAKTEELAKFPKGAYVLIDNLTISTP